MHNSLSFLTLLFMVPMLALAQTPQSQKELREDRMQALRVAFFVEELSLTPEESALFWPAWNEEEEKLKAHGDAVRAIETQLKSTESDEEAAELIQELKQLQRAGLELRHQAIDRIAAFIGYRRAGMIASGARIQNAGDGTDERKRIRQWPTSQRSQTAWPATLLRNQANTIDTVAHARRCWSVGKQMSEVAIACSTPNFDADHAVAFV